MKVRLIIALILLSTQTRAEPSDFARGSVVDTNDQALVARLQIPDDVYAWVSSGDLGDLRIYNGAQEAVPYAIRRPPDRDEYSQWQTMPLFPLPDSDPSTTSDARVQVQLDAGGTVVAISGNASIPTAIAAFLVDANTFGLHATQLRVDWDGQDTIDFVGKLRIEDSANLDDWRTLVETTTIANLTSHTQAVRVDRVELPGGQRRYLRLTQLAGNDRINLTKVQLRQRETQLPPRRWQSIEGTAANDGFEFVIAGHYPVDRVSVHPSGTAENYFATAVLYSRSLPSRPWQPRGQHRFYRTATKGLVAESEPMSIAHSDHYWRVEFVGDGLSEPALRIGWLPDEIVFLQQGNAPYLLAYGQVGITGQQWPMQQLLKQLSNGADSVALEDIQSVQLLAPVMLGGPERLRPAAAPINWRTIVLWVVLLLGVAIVGGFAIRLLKT